MIGALASGEVQQDLTQQRPVQPSRLKPSKGIANFHLSLDPHNSSFVHKRIVCRLVDTKPFRRLCFVLTNDCSRPTETLMTAFLLIDVKTATCPSFWNFDSLVITNQSGSATAISLTTTGTTTRLLSQSKERALGPPVGFMEAATVGLHHLPLIAAVGQLLGVMVTKATTEREPNGAATATATATTTGAGAATTMYAAKALLSINSNRQPNNQTNQTISLDRLRSHNDDCSSSNNFQQQLSTTRDGGGNGRPYRKITHDRNGSLFQTTTNNHLKEL